MPYKDPEKAKENQKKYYEANRQKLITAARSRYLLKQEEINAYARERYSKIRHTLITGEGKGHGKGKEFKKGNVPWNAGTRSTGYKSKMTHEGMRSEHRLVMESVLGRKLTSKEVVHHWDEDKLNNQEENLGLFRHSSAHSRLHSFADRHEMKVAELRFEQPWLNTAV